MPFPILAAVSIGATLFSTYQRYQADKADERALKKKAKLLNVQAQEVLGRNVENRQLMLTQGKQILGQQATSLARLGIQATEGSSLSELEQSLSVLKDEWVRSRREALYEAKAIRSEASFTREQAKDLRGAMGIGAATSLLQGGIDTYLSDRANINKYFED